MNTEETVKRIDGLVRELNEASDAYYGGADEIMSNFEWDEKFDLLTRLENESGYIPENSPTRTVSSAEKDADGEKEEHEYPALSLAKTKSVADLIKWAGDKEVRLSWKLDGLTLVLTYDGGKLSKILTRGNGVTGTNITYLRDAIKGVPQKLSYPGHLVVRGEATISYTDFERINDSLSDDDDRYANPRNLASGTLALDRKNIDIVRERNLTFNAFSLVHIDDEISTLKEQIGFLTRGGFTFVDGEFTDASGLPSCVEKWTEKVERGEMDIPVDGLVLAYNDIAYASGGSVTGHHQTRGGYAFKWQDESAVSTLDHIEWSCASSVITPVAVFDPVFLEGTTVSRASLCNLSEIKRLGIGEDRKTVLEIIKANKIIPKCISVKEKTGTVSIPGKCPVCSSDTYVFESESGTETLRCSNPDCPAKKLKRFEKFVSRTGMDIDGLSIETMRDFINEHFIADYADIYHLADHAEEIKVLEGYGEKSVENILSAVEKSRDADPARLIVSISIPLIGRDAAKKIVSSIGFDSFLERMKDGKPFDDIDGFGEEKSNSILAWYKNDANRESLERLLPELNIKREEAKAGSSLAGMTFVITGDVHHYANRDAFKEYVESQGGKVAGSVSKKTDFLVNNDITSVSSKNQKAKELGIEIITEDDFIERFAE